MSSSLFSPFNHYYALFAGLSSALIGIKEIRHFIEETIAKLHQKIEGRIDIHIREAESLITQYKVAITSLINKEKYTIAKNIIESMERRQNKIKIFRRRKKSLDPDVELKSIQKKLTSLHIYVFLFSVFMLLIAGFNEAEYISGSMSLTFVANSEILAVISVIILLLFLKPQLNYSALIISMALFSLTMIISFSLSYFGIGWFNLISLFVVIISLIICAMPLIVLVTTSYIVWTGWQLLTNILLLKEKVILDKEAAKVTNTIMKISP